MDQGDERPSLRPYLISAEKISKAVKAKPLQPCGLAALAGVSDTAAAILKRADQALYRAKRDGRNRVVADAA